MTRALTCDMQRSHTRSGTPEFRPKTKDRDEKWVVRHTAICHRFNADTLQNVIVLFNPAPNSKAHKLAEEYLLSLRHEPAKSQYHLHQILIAAYVPGWRRYMATQELEALPIVSRILLPTQCRTY